jgi:hypothetical protein
VGRRVFFTRVRVERLVVTQSILDVFRQSGDDQIGQTLLRLARLAEARHRFEQAASLSIHPSIQRKDRPLTQGSENEATVREPGKNRASIHMEVDR